MTDLALGILPIVVDLNRSGVSKDGFLYVFLSPRGTRMSLERQGITPCDGAILKFYCEDGDGSGRRDDLVFQAPIHYAEPRGWYAKVPVGDVRHLSEVADDPTHWAHAVNWTSVHEAERTWF